MKNFVTSQDAYGVPISLTYNGENTFRTLGGGIITIISRLAILSYFLYQFREISNHKKVVTRKTNYINLVEEDEIYLLNNTNFDIGLIFNINDDDLKGKVWD